jgi:Spy/CpxP family protein refolding chaperone
MENRNTIILKWSVGILIVLNTVLLITFWKNNEHVKFLPKNKHHSHVGFDGPKSMIEDELDLDDAQKRKFMELVKVHQDGMKVLHDEGKVLREDLFQQLHEVKTDTNQVTDLMHKIAENQIRIEQITFNHFKELMSICSEEQKKKFSKILPHILEQLKQGGPRPPKHH